jgi:hypothetical protein
MECRSCGYVQTEAPHWLARAYAESINDSDTGILQRNCRNARIVIATLIATGDLRGRVVDFAGGYGILTRLLRDMGVDAFWSDQYSANLLARGFEDCGESASLITAFEAFEHFVDPGSELDKMLAIAPNVLLSTEIISEPSPGDWWYYGREHGQHIGFFRVRTLELLASKRQKHFLTDGHSYHLMSDKPIGRRFWRFLMKVKRALPIFLPLKLESRTWGDHLTLAHRARGKPRS